jgi:hypothetical protein
MFSCGEDSENRENDLSDLLSANPCNNNIGTDNFFCKGSSTFCTSSTYPKGTHDQNFTLDSYPDLDT